MQIGAVPFMLSSKLVRKDMIELCCLQSLDRALGFEARVRWEVMRVSEAGIWERDVETGCN